MKRKVEPEVDKSYTDLYIGSSLKTREIKDDIEKKKEISKRERELINTYNMLIEDAEKWINISQKTSKGTDEEKKYMENTKKSLENYKKSLDEHNKNYLTAESELNELYENLKSSQNEENALEITITNIKKKKITLDLDTYEKQIRELENNRKDYETNLNKTLKYIENLQKNLDQYITNRNEVIKEIEEIRKIDGFESIKSLEEKFNILNKSLHNLNFFIDHTISGWKSSESAKKDYMNKIETNNLVVNFMKMKIGEGEYNKFLTSSKLKPDLELDFYVTEFKYLYDYFTEYKKKLISMPKEVLNQMQYVERSYDKFTIIKRYQVIGEKEYIPQTQNITNIQFIKDKFNELIKSCRYLFQFKSSDLVIYQDDKLKIVTVPLIPRDINGRLFSWDVALVLNSYIIKNNFNSEFFITLEEGKNLGWKLKNNMEQEGVQVNINNNLSSIIYYHLELCFEMNDLSKKKTPLNVVNELKLDKITEYIDGSFKEKINNCYRDLTTFNGHPVFIETNKILNRDEDPSGVSAWTIRSTTKEMFKNSSVYIENNTELNNIIFANIDKGNYHFVVNYPILWYSSIEYYLAIIAHEIGHVLSRILNYRFNSTVIEELTVDLFSNRICMDYGLYFTHEMYSIIYDCWLVKYKELADEDLETAITFSNLIYDEFKKRLIIKDEDEIPGEILKLF